MDMRGLVGAFSAMTAAAALCATALPAQAGTMLNVNWNSGCGKASCFNEHGVFTQTWSAGDAHGPMTIGQFLLERGVLGSLDGQTFNISFSIGGQTVGTWGNYNMAAIAGDELNFSGENFVWNPEDGDLVLTLSILHQDTSGGGGFRLFAANEGGGGGGGDNGLPTPPDQGQFDVGGLDDTLPNVQAVPEPATWAMMIAGFGLAGATLRQRRRIVA
jgi:hypothetical protein